MPGFDMAASRHGHINQRGEDGMITRSLPNLFTIGNLVLGVVSIILVFNGEVDLAAMLVIVAMLLDGLDGRVARALNVQSEFGKELDSLSDVISFGVAPAFVVYAVAFQGYSDAAYWTVIAWAVTSLFPICGALRLARFNVTDGPAGYFIGLPIPAAGGVLATVALFHSELSAPVLVVTEMILSFLMISTIKYPNFKHFGLSRRMIWILPLLVATAVTVALLYPGFLSKLLFVPLVIYALFGLKKNVRRRKPRRARKDADDRTKLKDL
jgi:CDP-diacylglycerol--serine O-phosphatidyltransferase